MRPAVFFLLIASLPAEAASAEGTTSKGVAMRYGPVLTLTVEAPPEGTTAADRPARPTAPAPPPPDALARIVARKGLVIQLAENDEGYVCFDPDTLRMAAGWENGFLDLSETNIGAFKGNRTGAGVIAGEILFQNADAPGWSKDEQFADPRPLKSGPLPRDAARFHGVYLAGRWAVLSYRVGDCEVVEAAELVKTPRGTAILRHLECGPSQKRRCMLLASIDAERSAELRCLVRGSTLPHVADSGKHRYLDIPPHTEPLRFTIAIYRDAEAAPPPDAQWDQSRNKLPSNAELAEWRVARQKIRGGDSRWPQTFVLRGEVSKNAAAYVVDTIPLPEENPWKSWMRISALDFFPDGRAAVATLNGDVWLVSRIDERLEEVRWKRYAVGFYEPLGLKIVDGAIHVHGRDQITRLHDFDGDDEADFYECFNNDRAVYPSYHAYAYDLQTDRAGNFYYVVGGAWLGTERPWHAALFKLTPDGARSDIVATGFRAPNGMAIGPNDQITVSDNQGNWMPASKISLVRPGGFYGFVADPRVEPNAKGAPDFEAPLCWIPQAIDNSSGGQVWAPEGWGPFGGHLLHTSYGAAALFAVLIDARADLRQGGVVKYPLKFDSGIMRGRFSPRDGQLYLAGLKGWQTAGVKDGCLQRVRYTGAPLYLPTGLRIEREAIVLSFAVPLEPLSAADAESFAIEQWNYRWSSAYGSPELSALRPGEPGRDLLAISKATLVGDGRSVRLHIPHLKQVMQMLIKMNLVAADGTRIEAQIANTIHRVPEG